MNTKNKKEKDQKKTEGTGAEQQFGKITSGAELKIFLHSLLDRFSSGEVAPLYALTAINHMMNLSDINKFLDNESKEVARDIWLRIKTSGLQVSNPPLLFSAEEANPAA